MALQARKVSKAFEKWAQDCNLEVPGSNPWGDSHIKRTGVSSNLLGVKKPVPLRVFIPERSTAGAFVVPFRALC